MVADRGHTADCVSVGQLSAKGASWQDSASCRKRSFGWHSDVGLIDQRIVPRPKLQSLTSLPRTMTETPCDQIGTWKLIRRRPTLALPKSECLRKSSPYRRPYISRP